MKPLLLSFCLVLYITASAQQVKKPLKPTTPKQNNIYKKPAANNSNATMLTQSSSYAAKAGTSPLSLRAGEPVIKSFNYYALPQYSNGRLAGMPRGTYGFGRGQLFLRSTDATTSGGITGSGGVGTGSSAGGVGMGGFATGVNGKSVFAGPAMWGSARNLALPDSVLRKP